MARPPHCKVCGLDMRDDPRDSFVRVYRERAPEFYVQMRLQETSWAAIDVGPMFDDDWYCGDHFPPDRVVEVISERALNAWGRPGTRPGDTALSAVMPVHGMIMNGGMFHARDVLSGEQLAAGVAGLRYLEMTAAADAVDQARLTPTDVENNYADTDSDLFEELTDRYNGAVPADSVIDDHLRLALRRRPDDFLPAECGPFPQGYWRDATDRTLLWQADQAAAGDGTVAPHGWLLRILERFLNVEVSPDPDGLSDWVLEDPQRREARVFKVQLGAAIEHYSAAIRKHVATALGIDRDNDRFLREVWRSLYTGEPVPGGDELFRYALRAVILGEVASVPRGDPSRNVPEVVWPYIDLGASDFRPSARAAWRLYFPTDPMPEPISHDQAVELVRSELEPAWRHGTFCIDDRLITETDAYFVVAVGAREFLADGDRRFEAIGGVTVVYKSGRIGSLPSAGVATDPTLRSRSNPAATFNTGDPE